jgi:hypothetical protein
MKLLNIQNQAISPNGNDMAINPRGIDFFKSDIIQAGGRALHSKIHKHKISLSGYYRTSGAPSRWNSSYLLLWIIPWDLHNYDICYFHFI